jgi:leader peptidase (prepilin peptidase) / N-methyltransferase
MSTSIVFCAFFAFFAFCAFWLTRLGFVTQIWFWFHIVMGAVVGSFLNVVILRVPEGTFLKHTRSHCPSCQAAIPFYFNIPILGWMILRGRSACCKKKISLQYPLVELVTAVIWAIWFLKFPYVSPNQEYGFVWHLPDLWRYIHAVVFSSIMIVVSVIDLRLMIIPDKISLPMLALSPVVVWLHPDLTLKSSIIGIVLGGGFLYGIAWLYWFLRKQYGMGFGDVKLLALIGGWLGYQSIFPTLFIGSMVGSIIGVLVLIVARKLTMQAKVPFGPFLAAGALIHLWFGNEFFMQLGRLSEIKS